MKLKQFVDELNVAMDIMEAAGRSGEEISVRVLLDMPSLGPRRMVDIKSVSSGFDWESKFIILKPEQKLVLKNVD